MYRLVILFLFTIPILNGCTNSVSRDDLLRLNNSDVTWNGNYFGLTPVLSIRAKEIVDNGVSMNDQAILLSKLNNENCFVISHVILTLSRGVPESIGASKWNRMSVDLLASGVAEYEESETHLLYEFWKEKLKSEESNSDN